MTTKEKLISMLVERGMFESQAKEVVESSITQINFMTPSYRITWDSRCEDYPDSMYDVWFFIMKPIALNWINENKPNAWFKPMFV